LVKSSSPEPIGIATTTSQMPPLAFAPSAVEPVPVDEPSATQLVERAVSMGPPRTTWESYVLPSDPILDVKRQPHVAERRARLTRIVKVTLGACLAVCIVAIGISAVSAVSSDSSSGDKSPVSGSTASAKTVPAKAVVPVEPLTGTRHAKAVRHGAPAATMAAIGRPKRR
jgi:hypothetical protein